MAITFEDAVNRWGPTVKLLSATANEMVDVLVVPFEAFDIPEEHIRLAESTGSRGMCIHDQADLDRYKFKAINE